MIKPEQSRIWKKRINSFTKLKPFFSKFETEALEKKCFTYGKLAAIRRASINPLQAGKKARLSDDQTIHVITIIVKAARGFAVSSIAGLKAAFINCESLNVAPNEIIELFERMVRLHDAKSIERMINSMPNVLNEKSSALVMYMELLEKVLELGNSYLNDTKSKCNELALKYSKKGEPLQ